MPSESLSYRYTHTIQNFPEKWLPLIHLYDADLPLFPLYYFHVLPGNLSSESRPGIKDRAFGYVEKTNLSDSGLEVSIICNKDLTDPNNSAFLLSVTSEIEERFGVLNPVELGDVSAAFRPPLDYANQVLVEIWHRVVQKSFGDSLPFGRFLDPVFGLARFVASWYSPGGRKSEWIQTHYFASRFGEKIQPAEDTLMDFYLLPTFGEVSNQNNPLNHFPQFQALCGAAKDFHTAFCSVESIGGGLSFSKFNRPFSGSLNTAKLQGCISSLSTKHREALIECFNAFDKGPMRTIIFLQMLNDIRDGRLVPQNLNSTQFGLIYDSLGGFYQTPKVIALYAQQCFGNTSALPIDTWIETFMKWPLMVYPTQGNELQAIFAGANNLGKVERLLWIAGQARKVHSSLCDDALWCIKYDSTGVPRGANPFSCNACLQSIRDACPAHAQISNQTISFNGPHGSNIFKIETSGGNNTSPNQQFKVCKGRSVYGEIHDDFTPVDFPSAFAPFPQPSHRGKTLTVEEFVRTY